jgi:hypothetical protein
MRDCRAFPIRKGRIEVRTGQVRNHFQQTVIGINGRWTGAAVEMGRENEVLGIGGLTGESV